MLDIQQLAVIAGVARAGSYTAAAELLGYTQPAVSYRMRSLERAIGVPLTVRSGRGVRLTPAGHRLAERAETILATLRAVENEFGAYAAQARGTVRVSAIPSVCVALLPEAVARLRAARPDVGVVADKATSGDAYRALREGTTDLALVVETETESEPDDVSTTVSIPLLSDLRCVLLPAGHHLAEQRTLGLADLFDEEWILDSGRSEFLSACAEIGFSPRTAAITEDHATAHGLVAHGVGVALTHGLALPPYQDPRVAIRPLRDWPVRRVHAVLRPETMKVPAVMALVSAVRATADARMAADAAVGLGTGTDGTGTGTAADRDDVAPLSLIQPSEFRPSA
ncbi:LysR family transcriptional regulator [Streptomyces sp. NPDC088400]|uniref:LysR family transcriptional regulator n=1 Tax=Streptomyces sp. NPDC088400 TaxID=3365861 RepID=UPI0037FDE64D